jgi:hypothetical protein
MPTIVEGALCFDFPHGWNVSQFDDWSFVRNQFQSVGGGSKAIDILAIEPDLSCVWHIEVKDYRRRQRDKSLGLAEEVAQKVRDSLAALAAARVNANDDAEKAMAETALRGRRLRIVLHLEQTAPPSRLFPPAVDAANVRQRLKQVTKAIDPHPLVCGRTDTNDYPWEVR